MCCDNKKWLIHFLSMTQLINSNEKKETLVIHTHALLVNLRSIPHVQPRQACVWILPHKILPFASLAHLPVILLVIIVWLSLHSLTVSFSSIPDFVGPKQTRTTGGSQNSMRILFWFQNLSGKLSDTYLCYMGLLFLNHNWRNGRDKFWAWPVLLWSGQLQNRQMSDFKTYFEHWTGNK